MNPNTAQSLWQVGIAVFGILAILSTFGSYHYGNKVKAIEKQEAVEIKKLLLSLQSTDKKDHSKLIQKYPLGYTLFASDHKEIVVPNINYLAKDYEIKWDNAKIYKVTPTEIHLDLPDITYKPSGGGIQNCGMIISRIVGQPQQVPFIRWPDTNPFVELLEDSEEKIVLVIGFKKK